MADFGQGGTRTAKNFASDVIVNGTTGEHLAYTLTVKGGMPDFAFTCQHQDQVPITSADKFQGHPRQVYAWKLWKALPANASPTDFVTDTVPKDIFGVGVFFAGATEYTLRIEQRDGNDSLIKVVQDINYRSQTPTDTVTEGLGVTWN